MVVAEPVTLAFDSFFQFARHLGERFPPERQLQVHSIESDGDDVLVQGELFLPQPVERYFYLVASPNRVGGCDSRRLEPRGPCRFTDLRRVRRNAAAQERVLDGGDVALSGCVSLRAVNSKTACGAFFGEYFVQGAEPAFDKGDAFFSNSPEIRPVGYGQVLVDDDVGDPVNPQLVSPCQTPT